MKLVVVSVPYEITLLSNIFPIFLMFIIVSVPYEITLLSNIYSEESHIGKVSVPYEITLLSNYDWHKDINQEFQYLMKLHYSQTNIEEYGKFISFQYLMKLHYSQTM